MSNVTVTPSSENPVPGGLEVVASNDSTTSDVQARALPASAGTAPVAPMSVGALLRDAREKAGLSSADIATKLRMGLKQVVALENSDYAAVPTGTFLRGFVRNYAKAVSLNADEVLVLLEKTHSGAAAVKASSVVVPSLQNIKVPSPGGELATPNGRALVVGIVALLLLAAIWYWWEYVFPHRNDVQRANVDAGQSIVTPLASPASSVPVSLPETVVVATGTPQPGVDNATPVPSPEMPPKAADVANVATTLATAPPVVVATVAALPPPLTIANEPEPAPVRSLPPPLPAPGARSATLGFTFSGESWVEVVDASGKTILSRRFKAGDAEEVFGRAPFSVIVGNAKSTRMAFNGREFSLEPHTRVSVARVTVK
ncbi:MAG: helix-turn-helix domain-containing protein [Betaproteobacteria bacterium]|nr:helix-turn-helix domain-containing protein [Betaproteobacteria bacterium]